MTFKGALYAPEIIVKSLLTSLEFTKQISDINNLCCLSLRNLFIDNWLQSLCLGLQDQTSIK